MEHVHLENQNLLSSEDNIPEPVQPAIDFMPFIVSMCAAHNWTVREVDNEHAVIEFTLDKTRTQTLFIFGFDDDAEFSVPSFAAFESMDKVPHFISSSLLQINAKTKIGFWCLEQIGEKLVYTFMHNASISHLDEELFSEIVTTLIQRVDEFENLLIKMSGEGNPTSEITQ
jgi:hypothetical protein